MTSETGQRRILALDCASEACSAALFTADGALLGYGLDVIGRGHAERLVPMIAGLDDKGRADEIRVGLGPGSFTGTRIALAAARALGVAWNAPVRGFPTLALVAAGAQGSHMGAVSVAMTGGHGQWFVQDFDADGLPQAPFAAASPDEALQGWNHAIVAGNKARALADHQSQAGIDIEGRVVIDALPDARHALALPPSLLTDALAPIYGRAPDAQPAKTNQ